MKLEDVLDVDLPIPEFMKAKKAWENKLKGIEAEEEEEEEVEMVLSDEVDYATQGASIISKSSAAITAARIEQDADFFQQEAPVDPISLEANLLLPREERREIEIDGIPETRFVFANDDTNQYLVLDLGAPRIPSKLGADFAKAPDTRAVHDAFVVEVSADGETYFDWGRQDTSEESTGTLDLFPKPESYSGPEEIRYVRYKFGPHTKGGQGCAVSQIFAFGRSKVKKEQEEQFPALCSDGRHLLFLHAASVKSKDSAEKEQVLKAFVFDSLALQATHEFKLQYEKSFQWGIPESLLSACTFACNSTKLLVAHRKGFAARTKEEKDVEFNFRVLDLNSGKQISFSEATFSKVSISLVIYSSTSNVC